MYGGGFGGRSRGRGGGGYRDRRDVDVDLSPQAERFRKLFIGGLSYETDDAGLRQHFEEYGNVIDCVVMKDPTSKKSRGFGFVTFEKSEELDLSQEGRPHVINDREVETKRAMPKDESEKSEAQVTVKKIFIGGLKDDTTGEHIREACEAYGKVDDVAMITDKATGKARGFCFVQFADTDTVDKLFLRKHISVNGRTVDVKKAQPREGEVVGRGGRGRGRGGGYGSYGGGQGYGYGGYGDSYGSSYGGGSYGGGSYGGDSYGGYAYYGGGPIKSGGYSQQSDGRYGGYGGYGGDGGYGGYGGGGNYGAYGGYGYRR